MHRGYVKLWRKLEDTGIWKHSNALTLYVWLAIRAVQEPTKTVVAGRVVDLEPGQTAVTVIGISEVLGMTSREVRTALNDIQKLSLTTNKTTNRFTVVSIMNPNIYETQKNENDKQNDKQTTNRTQTELLPAEEEKPLKEEVRPRRVIPPKIEDVAAYCLERGNRVDPEIWMDHYKTNGWKVGKTKMVDWQAAIRNAERRGWADKNKQGPVGLGLNPPPRGAERKDTDYGF